MDQVYLSDLQVSDRFFCVCLRVLILTQKFCEGIAVVALRVLVPRDLGAGLVILEVYSAGQYVALLIYLP